MTDAIAPWVAGQQVELGGRLYTVDRVTPSGRAFVRNAWFNADGTERGVSRDAWHKSQKLQHVTPAIAERVSLQLKVEKVHARVTEAQRYLAELVQALRRPPNSDRSMQIQQLYSAIGELLPGILS